MDAIKTFAESTVAHRYLPLRTTEVISEKVICDIIEVILQIY